MTNFDDNFGDDDHKVHRYSSQVPEVGHSNDTCCCGDDDYGDDCHGGGDDGDGDCHGGGDDGDDDCHGDGDDGDSDAYLIGNGKVVKGKMRRRHCCFDSLRIL